MRRKPRVLTKALQKDGGAASPAVGRFHDGEKTVPPTLRGSNQDRTHVGFGEEQVLRHPQGREWGSAALLRN